MPIVSADDPSSDFFFIEKGEPEEILATLKTLVQERIPRKFGLHPTRDIQVLSPMHKGLLGAATLNAELQALLNPSGQSVTRGTRVFRLGDKVMQIRNNYDLESTTATSSHRVHRRGERTVPPFSTGARSLHDQEADESLRWLTPALPKSLQRYPLSRHPLHTRRFVMLRRGATPRSPRGRRLVVIVGSSAHCRRSP